MPVEKKYKFSPPEERGVEKKALLIVGAIIIMAIIIIAAFALIKKKDEIINIVIPKITIKEPGNVSTKCEDDKCLLESAVKEASADLCDKIVNITLKQGCFTSIASKSLDACLKLEDYQTKRACLDKYAKDKKSTYLCSQLN